MVGVAWVGIYADPPCPLGLGRRQCICLFARYAEQQQAAQDSQTGMSYMAPTRPSTARGQTDRQRTEKATGHESVPARRPCMWMAGATGTYPAGPLATAYPPALHTGVPWTCNFAQFGDAFLPLVAPPCTPQPAVNGGSCKIGVPMSHNPCVMSWWVLSFAKATRWANGGSRKSVGPSNGLYTLSLLCSSSSAACWYWQSR